MKSVNCCYNDCDVIWLPSTVQNPFFFHVDGDISIIILSIIYDISVSCLLQSASKDQSDYPAHFKLNSFKTSWISSSNMLSYKLSLAATSDLPS